MTATVAQKKGFTADSFDAFLASRSEPVWLTDSRRAAWKLFEETPMPSRGEEWMRTDIRLLRLDKFAIPGGVWHVPEGTEGRVEAGADSNLAPGLLTRGVSLAGSTVSHNSHVVTSHLDKKWREKGVLFGALDTLLAEHGEKLRPHFQRAIPANLDKFAALRAAVWSGGSLLYVPKDVKVDEPLHMLSALTNGGADITHALVVLEEGAEATLLAETAGDDSPALHSGAIELVVGPSARLRYVNLQNWGSGAWHFAHQKAVLAKDATLQWTIGALGARLAKVNQHVELSGEFARAQVNGVMFTEGKQHLSYHTLQHHRAANCKSDLLYKGALQDQSRVVWRGMIKVDTAAQKTDGYQRNDNLMLSEDARADSIPGLEIEADDVRCTHGSTTGRVDDDQIFYARCRGLTRKEAVRMVVAGFFQQVFDRITIEPVRDALGEAIGRRIREYD